MSDGDQIRLKGMWTEYGEACPHYRGSPAGPGTCIQNENRSCEYELGNFCQEWRDILEEWHKEEKYLCPTCLTLCPGDEQVAKGKSCRVCAGDYTLPSRIRSMQGRAT